MAHRIVLVLAAIAGFLVYRLCLLTVVGYATVIQFPSWWLDVVPRHAHGIFLWSFLCNTVAVLAVSLPFAWLLARHYGRAGLYVAAAAGIALVVPDIPSAMKYLRYMTSFDVTFIAIDTAKMLLSLPVLVWVIRMLPSNYALQRTGER